MLHRDLKGDNVILGDFGEVIVLDWGLAKLLPEAGQGATINQVDEPPVAVEAAFELDHQRGPSRHQIA